MKPILKWAGGKQRLIEQIRPLLPSPEIVERYHEPFVGGGTVFFDGMYETAVLSDANEKLVMFYRMVKNNVDELMRANTLLSAQYHALETKEERAKLYYQVRDMFNKRQPPIEVLLFLNKTGFNGLYRVNRKGKFNVPHGRNKNPTIVDAGKLIEANRMLASVEIHWQDFRDSLDMVAEGDFVYCDPPYVPESATADFTSYTKEDFGYQDQVDLRDRLKNLNVQGVRWAVSNSDTPLVRELYKGFNFHELQVRRSISRKGNGRKIVTELFITNY